LPVGVLVLVVGSLLVFNAWVIVDAELAVSAAAREGARAAVETVDSAATSTAAARARAQSTMAAHGRSDANLAPIEVALPDGFRRCGRVVVTVRYEVPAISLPRIGGLGSITAAAVHAEVIDPYRSGPAEVGPCP
jgi:hypothetical protein